MNRKKLIVQRAIADFSDDHRLTELAEVKVHVVLLAHLKPSLFQLEAIDRLQHLYQKLAGHLRHRSEEAGRRQGLGHGFAAGLLICVLCSLHGTGCAVGPVASGRRAMDDGAYETAARHFREAAEANPNDPERWRELGRAELFAERPVRARRALSRAAALRPDQAAPRILIGMTWELQRRYDEAVLAYRQACELEPQSARGYTILGTRLLRWGQPEAAVEPLARSVELAPDNPETWNALGLARHEAGDLRGAEEAFRGGLGRHREHRGLYLGLAALLINSRRHEEALSVYDQVVERWELFAAAHAGRGILLHELGRTREAEEAFVRAAEVARDPRPYRIRLQEYRALLRSGAEPERLERQ